MTFDPVAALRWSEDRWPRDILPTLEEYVRIPNVSAAYDPQWQANGHMDRAATLLHDWARSRHLDGLSVELVELEGRSPLVFCELPAVGASSAAADDDTVLLYGHLDKQPPMEGWRTGLGPWTPVREGDRLYGRGSADDGYALFAALTALEAVREAGGSHARTVMLIEASEESGSPDLPTYVEHLSGRIGRPSLVVCLDSGCADYERMWITTSLRGNLVGVLSATVLEEGVHSGSAGGIVPDSFLVLRRLLDRIEDSSSGRVVLPELWVEVPDDRADEMAETARQLGSEAAGSFPWKNGTRAQARDAEAALRAKTWEPALAYVGAGGLPAVEHAGNVLRPSTELALSFRLPPTCDAASAAQAITEALVDDPPFGAEVRFEVRACEGGWNAPSQPAWLTEAVTDASHEAFGASPRYIGEGGTIPFMGMLGARYPDAQFVVTGVLGPGSNAHGPNEFLHLPTATRLTAAVASIVNRHATRLA